MIDKAMPTGNNKTLKIIVIAVVVVLAISIAYMIYQSLKKAADVAGNLAGDQALATTTRVSIDRVTYLRSVAANLWTNAVDRPWYAAWTVRDYDEAKFIDAINQCNNVNEAAVLDSFYKEQSGETLKDVIVKSFSSADSAKVKAELLAFLRK